MIDAPTRAALRALRDCTVVRAGYDHPGYRSLRFLRLAVCEPAGAEWDYRLTPRGVQLAKETFR